MKKFLTTSAILLFSPLLAIAQAAQTSAQRCENFKAQFAGEFNWVPSAYCSAGGAALFAIKILLQFSGFAAVIFIMVGGFFYLSSAGNEEAAEKGKSILINAVIGLVVVILATTIVTVVSNLITTGQ